MKKNKLIDVEVFEKKRFTKTLIIIIIGVLVIVLSSVAAMILLKDKEKEIAPDKSQEEQENQVQEDASASEGNALAENLETVEEYNTKIPVYSEEAKQKMNNIYASNDEEKTAYLTFDDGPSNTVTPQILEILRNENIKATFFVLGSRVEACPEIVEQEYEEGHFIANHGYSHVYGSVYASPQAVLDEYNRTEEKIREALGDGYSSHLFRFPGGSEGGKYAKVKDEAKKLLEANNIAYVNWNALTNDSVGKPTHESLVEDLKKTSNGKQKIVVLMHDTAAKQMTADTLPQVISYLREQGYIFRNFYDIMK